MAITWPSNMAARSPGSFLPDISRSNSWPPGFPYEVFLCAGSCSHTAERSGRSHRCRPTGRPIPFKPGQRAATPLSGTSPVRQRGSGQILGLLPRWSTQPMGTRWGEPLCTYFVNRGLLTAGRARNIARRGYVLGCLGRSGASSASWSAFCLFVAIANSITAFPGDWGMPPSHRSSPGLGSAGLRALGPISVSRSIPHRKRHLTDVGPIVWTGNAGLFCKLGLLGISGALVICRLTLAIDGRARDRPRPRTLSGHHPNSMLALQRTTFLLARLVDVYSTRSSSSGLERPLRRGHLARTKPIASVFARQGCIREARSGRAAEVP